MRQLLATAFKNTIAQIETDVAGDATYTLERVSVPIPVLPSCHSARTRYYAVLRMPQN